MVESEFTYELETHFDYGKVGELVTAKFITLKVPSTKDIVFCSQLKQAFMRSVPKDTGEITDEQREAAKKEGDLNGTAIMFMIAASPDVKLENVLLSAKELFTSNSGLALIDGETKLTKPLAELMSIDDLETMTGEYLANFILASSLQKMKNL